MNNSIKRTLERLLVKIHLPGFDSVRLLLEGLSIEFGRVIEMKNRVARSVVPNAGMDADSIEDYNDKYGIPQSLTGTDSEKINRIIERARLVGNGGAEFLQEQIQKAGFALYVIPNYTEATSIIQFGDIQFSDSIQFGLTTPYLDPSTVPGELIVGTPPGKDSSASAVAGETWPVPKEFDITEDATLWGFFGFLSPYPDRLAEAGELLSISQIEFNYLFKVVVSLKHCDWIVAQVSIS